MKSGYTYERLYRLDYDLLQKFLYEAIFQPDGQAKLPFSIVEQPVLRKYIDGFGDYKGDYAMGVFNTGSLVGLVWVRRIKGYGFIDDATPELNISVLKAYRGQALGSNLIKGMIKLLREEGFERVSLSCQKENRAITLYKKLGFNVVLETDETVTMYYPLKVGGDRIESI